MYPPTPLEPLETNSIYESTIVVHDPRPISQCSFGPRNIQITSIWKMFHRSRTRKREDNFQPFWKSLSRALTRDLRGERNATTVELFSSQKGGRCVFSARRFVSIRTTTLFVELLRGSPPLLGAELFFLTAWDGITWEFFHDLRVLHGEICVGFFSLSLFLLPFFLFFFFFSAESSASKNLKLRSRCSYTYVSLFTRAISRDATFALMIFQQP